MRPIDSAYDRDCLNAENSVNDLLEAYEVGGLIPYEEIEALDDMALYSIIDRLEEDPGFGYVLKEVQK